MTEQSAPRYAGFWIRSTALSIDLLLYSLISFLVEQLLGANTYASKIVVTLAVVCIYVGSTASSWQGTPGKRLFGIKVVHTRDGTMDIKRAMLRLMAVALPLLPMLVVSFLPEVNKFTQGLQNLGPTPTVNDYVSYMSPYAQNHRTLIFAYGFSTLFFMVSLPFWYVPAAFTAEKKAVHDMLCHTRVVYRQKTA